MLDASDRWVGVVSALVGGVWCGLLLVIGFLRRPPRRRPAGAVTPPPAAFAQGPLGAVGRGVRRALGRWVSPRCSDRRLGALVVGSLAMLAVARLIGMLVLIGLAVLAVQRRRQRRLAHADAELNGLAELAALLQLTVDSGFSLRSGLEVVVPWLTGPVGETLNAALRRAAAGSLFADELEGCRDGFGTQARPLLAALLSAERHGAPLSTPLSLAASELRSLRRRATEEAARRIPLRLLPPLLLGTLPAFCLLTVVPLLAGSLDLVHRSAG